ncbi:MAG: lysophospholipid acyltransferase family protein [Pseudomonadota bacterium]
MRKAEPLSDILPYSTIRAATRAIALFVVTSGFVLYEAPWLLRRGRARNRTVQACYKAMCAIAGLQTSIIGERHYAPGTLYVCNHISYTDIPILGALLPTSFIAKSEVHGWPLIGALARWAGTEFVVRKPIQVRTHTQTIAERLQNDDRLVLFAEGTSSVGTYVFPFRSSLFSPAIEGKRTLSIQPITIAYVACDTIPIGRHDRAVFGWYGDMTLFDHLWIILGLKKISVRIMFHHPVSTANFDNRKELAQYCEDQVRNGLYHINKMRIDPFLAANHDEVQM